MREALAGYGAPLAEARDYLMPAHFQDAGLEGALLLARQNEPGRGRTPS
jgi:hypothetical protein